MTKSMIFAAALCGAAILSGTSAHAQGNRPFCYSGPATAQVWDCQYDSWAACQTFLNGIGGECMANPRFGRRVRGAVVWSPPGLCAGLVIRHRVS